MLSCVYWKIIISSFLAFIQIYAFSVHKLKCPFPFQVLSTLWSSAKHNMGMAFDRRIWKHFRACSQEFCHFDDYNWDWALYHISLTCLERKLQVLLVKAPRVFHVGECGVHHKKKDCDASKVVRKVQDLLAKAKSYLFPNEIQVSSQPPRKKIKVPKGNGGWGDLRDRTLCMKMADNRNVALSRVTNSTEAFNEDALSRTFKELGL